MNVPYEYTLVPCPVCRHPALVPLNPISRELLGQLIVCEVCHTRDRSTLSCPPENEESRRVRSSSSATMEIVRTRLAAAFEIPREILYNETPIWGEERTTEASVPERANAESAEARIRVAFDAACAIRERNGQS